MTIIIGLALYIGFIAFILRFFHNANPGRE